MSPVIDEVNVGSSRIYEKSQCFRIGFNTQKNNSIFLGVSAIKIDEDEPLILDHGDPQFVISTRTRISMNQYKIKLDHISARDSTGLGDT